VTTRFHHYYTPYQNIIYDDLLNLFCDINYIFVIILSHASSSHATYDENGHFVMEYVPFCDQSLQCHEQIVTDKHFSSSVSPELILSGLAHNLVNYNKCCF
jgi:hypothetical protein